LWTRSPTAPAAVVDRGYKGAAAANFASVPFIEQSSSRSHLFRFDPLRRIA